MSQLIELLIDADAIPDAKLEQWQSGYGADRYLKNCRSEEIKIRIASIWNNIIWPARERQIELINPEMDGPGLYEKLYHCYSELNMRREHLEVIQSKGWPSYLRVCQRFPEGLPRPDGALVRFNTKERARDFMRGHIRVGPASSYDNPSLCPAIRDKELRFEMKLLNSQLMLKIQNEKTGQYDHAIKLSTASMNLTSESDYFVCCFTDRIEYRYFDDFSHKVDDVFVPSDACVVIRDVPWFEGMLLEAVSNLKGLKGTLVGLNYYDPYVSSRDMGDFGHHKDVSRYKDISYAYQFERRFVWWPKTPTRKLEAFFVEIGSLEGRAELIELD